MSGPGDGALSLFRERFGRDAEGVWSAPGRVNLIGEHTDYNEGFVLPLAIDRRTFVALGRRDDGIVRAVSRLEDGTAELPLAELRDAGAASLLPEWSRYPFGVIWALGSDRALDSATGVDLAFDSEVPIGAGLSSSAALESSLAVALDEVWRLDRTARELAEIGRLAENDFVGAPTGIMDQTASMLGRRGDAVFLDCRSLESRPVPLGLVEAGLELLVVDTGVTHEHASGGYRERRADCDRGARRLGVASLRDIGVADLDRAADVLDEVTFRRVRHVVTENQRVLDTVARLHDAGPSAIGLLLDESHLSMRDDFEISTPELDLAVETARRNGAIGARMTGGGFGGSTISLVPAALVERIASAVTDAFHERGYATPAAFTVHPSDGAHAEAVA